jgi:thiamine biosynthesis lipoprotein
MHYSRFRSDSLIARISRNAGEYKMPEDFPPMIELYHKLYRATGGLVTPLIGQVLVDAGYDAAYSLKMNAPLARPPQWEDVISYTDGMLVVATPVLLDFGAAGKGYLVDLVSEIVESFGIDSYCVDAGGDIRHRGEEALRVGLEHPLDITQVIGVTNLHNKSLCASAGNRRAWGEMHHIMHPATLTPVSDIIATWVIADTTLIADGIATALFFTAPDRLAEFSFEYLILRKDFSIQTSPAFPAELFMAD